MTVHMLDAGAGGARTSVVRGPEMPAIAPSTTSGTVAAMTLHVPGGLLLDSTVDPFTLTRDLRTTGLQIATDAYLGVVAEQVCWHVDRLRAGLEPQVHAGRFDTLTAQAAAIVRQHVDTATADLVHRDPPFDLGVTLTLLPASAPTGALLGIVRAEMGAYREAFTALAGVQEYGWWDCEHPPVPADQWATRRQVWTDSLREGRFSDLGWTWSLFTQPGPTRLPAGDQVDLARVRVVAPSDEARAEYLASQMAAAAFTWDGKGQFPLSDFLDCVKEHRSAAAALIAPLDEADWTMPLTPKP